MAHHHLAIVLSDVGENGEYPHADHDQHGSADGAQDVDEVKMV